jgi:mutator protein MutT
MLDIKPPNIKFCPFCGDKLKIRIEEETERKYCQKDNWTYYPSVASAAAAVILDQDKVLLVKRNREPYKGYWMFPAGFVSYGEHPEEALKREVAEEVGMVVKEAEFLCIYQAEADPREMGHYVFFYKVKAKKGGKITDEEENEKVEWFSIDKLPEIGWKAHQKVAKLLKQGKI